jgi:hypothetical protein
MPAAVRSKLGEIADPVGHGIITLCPIEQRPNARTLTGLVNPSIQVEVVNVRRLVQVTQYPINALKRTYLVQRDPALGEAALRLKGVKVRLFITDGPLVRRQTGKDRGKRWQWVGPARQ